MWLKYVKMRLLDLVTSLYNNVFSICWNLYAEVYPVYLTLSLQCSSIIQITKLTNTAINIFHSH
jgi:hypothetical protein